MKPSTFNALLSFLVGVSWAFLIIGAWVTFQSFLFLGIVPSLMFTFIFIFVALFIILALEAISHSKERNEMMKEHARSIEELKKLLQNKDTTDTE